MQGENAEHWHKLCELAAVEYDPEKLMRLVAEVNRLLQEEQDRRDQRGNAAGVP